jgi:hypothetical protein
MRSSWTFSRGLALGVAVIVAQTTRETEAGPARTLQTSSQSRSPTSLTRLVQAT